MKNVVIFGAGKYGRQLNSYILHGIFPNKEERWQVLYFCDNRKTPGSYIDRIKVIAAADLNSIHKEYSLLISSAKIVDEVMQQLYNFKVSAPVYFVPEYVYALKHLDMNSALMPPYVQMDIQKPRLPYMEVNIVSHCNLKCNGCSACANIAPEKFATIDTFKFNLERLKDLFSGIRYLKLFGGEPLLHPQLAAFIQMARQFFPDSELVVHSNGLLVPEISEEVLDIMKKTDTSFRFTLYPPTGLKKRKIEERLNQFGVHYTFSEPIYEFRKVINDKGDYDANEIYKQCHKCVNLVLADGSLACGVEYIIDSLEKYFHIEIYKDKWHRKIDIHHTDMNGWEINKKLDTPTQLCAYCAFMNFKTTAHNAFSPWRCGQKEKLEDWII